MSAHDAVRRCVQRLRPHAKFIAVQHSSEFIDRAAELGEGFYTANLYDERIDANMMMSRLGRVMIQNTYIPSFAFNLFLCWLHHRRSADAGAGPSLDRLLRHNFKKFFAEQLYRATNRVPSRALLLETLLFEQMLMVEVFAAKAADAGLSADADAGANLMSFALSMHELGHFYLETKPGLWDALVQEVAVLGPIHARVKDHHPPDVAVEFQCDAYAVVGCLGQYESHAGPEFALRAILFAFAAYAAMYSASATAVATAAAWDRGPDERVDFRDVAPMPHVDYDVEWAIDRPFLQRARLVAGLCEALAAARGLSLYGDAGTLPLPPTIVDDLVKLVGHVFEGDDDNARRMSNLVAQALHGHDDGMEYLYLHSKVFRTNRPGPLTL